MSAIKELRKEKKLTQQQAAEILGISLRSLTAPEQKSIMETAGSLQTDLARSRICSTVRLSQGALRPFAYLTGQKML